MKKNNDSPKPNTIVFRNPVYVIYTIIAFSIFIISARIAKNSFGNLEEAIFRSLNELPNWMNIGFTALSFLGTLWMVLIISIFFLYKKNSEASLKIFSAGLVSYIFAFWLKSLEIRTTPDILLEKANIRGVSLDAYGFPTINVAIAAAVAIILYQYVPKKYHRSISVLVLLVALSQLYLGVNLPIDLIGGFTVGLFVGSVMSLLFGRKVVSRVTAEEVLQALKATYFPVQKVDVLNVDARGSSPFMVTDSKGNRYFLKVVNKDNFYADWIFKMWRKVVYKKLEDEVPFLTPKRQIEHESYVASLAYSNGIKTPKIVGIFEIKTNNWAQAQTAIDGKSLDKVDPKRITDKLLDKIFVLVSDLHKIGIVHRDLRSANIFIDKSDEPWLIDFGFSEAGVNKKQTYRDNVELLASLSVIVGHKRVVSAAIKNISHEELTYALPYISYSSLSSETTRLLKLNDKLLTSLISELSKNLKINEVKTVNIHRFKRKS